MAEKLNYNQIILTATTAWQDDTQYADSERCNSPRARTGVYGEPGQGRLAELGEDYSSRLADGMEMMLG